MMTEAEGRGRGQKAEAQGRRQTVTVRQSPASRFTFHVSRSAHLRAFTMIEIAISLAVIGFALVAIISVLPLGMNVQRENREETIINQDATVFMNAIRNGARGLDDLTNYVIAITNTVTTFSSSGTPGTTSYHWYTPTNSSDGFPISSGARIIGLLSTPRFVAARQGFQSNYVVAAVRSLSGPASEKFPQNNPDVQDLGFSYRMVSEVMTYGESYVNGNWYNPMVPNLQSNLHELRLTFRWPLARGTNAPGRQIYRTFAGGYLMETNEPGFPGRTRSQPTPYDLYFFEPRTYVKAP